MLAPAVPIAITLIVLLAATVRFAGLLPQSQQSRTSKQTRCDVNGPIRILIVLGSGGHTAEMLALLRNLDVSKYSHRSYVVSSGDAFSAQKAREFEQKLEEQHSKHYGIYNIDTIPRARRVHQSILTTPFSSLCCLWSCLSVLRRPELGTQSLIYPDVIITNGPGTGVIVVIASYVLRFLGFSGSRRKMRTVYVESWARVRRLSLSGKILLPVVDRFIVQWEILAEVSGGRAEYQGVLV